jgi:hypothetical protein
VCEGDDRPAKLNQAFWIGNLFGCFIWGITNDWFVNLKKPLNQDLQSKKSFTRAFMAPGHTFTESLFFMKIL